MYIFTQNGTNGKQKIPFFCCIQKAETANFYSICKTEAQAIFLSPFIICSSCKGKLSVCKRTERTKLTCLSMSITELLAG
jgi:hypothetical protein